MMGIRRKHILRTKSTREYLRNTVGIEDVFRDGCNRERESRSVMSDFLRPHGIVHGILQARILELVAVPISRGSSQARDRTQVYHIAGGFFTS